MRRFSGPIPGQSLTTNPKGNPWERPPEINDPEEAIQMHLTRLSNPEMLEDVLNLIELADLDIQTVVSGIMRGAVANGIHSIDVGLIVAPVVHEYIKQAAKAVGIEADDGFEDKNEKEKQRQAIIAARAKKKLSAMGIKPKEAAMEAVSENGAEGDVMEAMPTEEEATVAAPKGLMAKGGM